MKINYHKGGKWDLEDKFLEQHRKGRKHSSRLGRKILPILGIIALILLAWTLIPSDKVNTDATHTQAPQTISYTLPTPQPITHSIS